MYVGDCNSPKGTRRQGFEAPARNRYYYGKLLDAFHLDLEQDYHNDKRWLINRLAIGTGTLCGLAVVPTQNRRGVQVRAGAALDGLGREIVVPKISAPVDPTRPTDSCGQPVGNPILRGGVVTLYLCYHECPTAPAPVLADHCGPEETCEFGITEERYRLQIRPGLPDPPPDRLTPEQCRRIFGNSPRGSLTRLESARLALNTGSPVEFVERVNELRSRRGAGELIDPPVEDHARIFEDERAFWLNARGRRGLLCREWALQCPTPQDPCVALAVIALGVEGEVLRIENCAPRQPIYSNAKLLELILCLADRVDHCCAEPTVMQLTKDSGDNQVGSVGQVLAQPLVVQVTEGGNVVANEPVIFEAVGDGAIGDDPAALGPTFTTQTDAGGLAVLPVWQLGSAPGTQATLARIASGSPNQVIFRSTAREVARPPVVRALWPPTAAVLGPNSNTDWYQRFLKERRFDVTFDRAMNPAHLDTPDPWLGVWLTVLVGGEASAVMRLPLRRVTPTPAPVLGVSGIPVVYRVPRSNPNGGLSIAATFSTAVNAAAGIETNPSATMSEVRMASMIDASGRVSSFPREPFLAAATAPIARRMRVITLIDADAGAIVEQSAPNQLLDPDFQGALLDEANLKLLWSLSPGQTHQPSDLSIWNSLTDTGATLPESGNGTEGGGLQSWFEIELGGD